VLLVLNMILVLLVLKIEKTQMLVLVSMDIITLTIGFVTCVLFNVMVVLLVLLIV